MVQRDEGLLPRIWTLKAEHPFWGDRRVWAYLRFVEQRPVNKKRGLRRMREHGRLVPPHVTLQAKRTPIGSQPRPIKPNEWWGIDMPKVLVQGVGWVYIVVVLEWYTKAVVGYEAGIRCTTQQWLQALGRAVNRQFPNGARDQGLSLMRDNGCQPTSRAFMEACRPLGIHQAFTSDNNPKGNADPERFMRTLKEECLWLQDWTCPVQLMNARAHWISYDNEHYLHSALGYVSPRQFERDYHNRHGSPFVAA